jgi:UDP-N-acetylmuramoyl-tripeptide--D-alanyl-D-alanine ligase
LQFLLSLERPDGQFYRRYLVRSGEGWGRPSPYYDGEILLALVKAACYLSHDELRPVAQRSGDVLFEAWARKPLQDGQDAPLTKGFFQWGCMAYSEMHRAAWPGNDSAAGHAIALADWMIEVHRPLERRGNTGYAIEGVLSAYAVAEATGDAASQGKFRRVAEAVLAKLVTWQVGHSQANGFLRSCGRIDPQFVGGVMGAADDSRLRIDITQHQMHAVILARRYLLPPPRP